MMNEILGSLWFFLPVGVANIAPVIMTKLFGYGSPVDGGHTWRGKPVLGSHKTWQGLVSGTIAGGLFLLLQLWIMRNGWLSSWDVVQYGLIPWWLGFVMGFGGLFGDMVKSFFKRRSSVKPGKPWLPWDQSDYVLGGLVFTLLAWPLSWTTAVTILIGYPVLHVLVNLFGYYTGIQDEKF